MFCDMQVQIKKAQQSSSWNFDEHTFLEIMPSLCALAYDKRIMGSYVRPSVCSHARSPQSPRRPEIYLLWFSRIWKLRSLSFASKHLLSGVVPLVHSFSRTGSIWFLSCLSYFLPTNYIILVKMCDAIKTEGITT